MNIDWKLVGECLSIYENFGFQYVEVPWLCNREASMATCPDEKVPILASHPTLSLGYLTGSAEQSFIQMMLNGEIGSGRYCAATPCFRDDDLDELHHRYFFKIELIDINSVDQNIDFVISRAIHCMQRFTNQVIEMQETDLGIDLVCNGIEVGSYGYREYKDFKWTYGTGLALPRFSQVCMNE